MLFFSFSCVFCSVVTVVLLWLLLFACFYAPVTEGFAGGVTVCHEPEENWGFHFLLLCLFSIYMNYSNRY